MSKARCFHGGAFFEAIGEDLDHLERRSAVINADVLDAWFPAAPAVLNSLATDLSWLVRTSPPTHASGLVRAIARARGVPPQSVLVGSGSSDLIFLALSHWLGRDARVLLLDPTYGEYAHVCEQVIGCHVDRFRLHPENGYRVDLTGLRSRIAEGYDLVVLVNPNNPTGQHIDRSELADVLAHLPRSSRCWIDEAYVEYAGADQSMEQFAAASHNVIVCKSLSKVLALSGLRAAYLVADEGLVSDLRRLTPPWAVSLPAQLAAIRALEQGDYYASCYTRTRELQAELAAGLREIAAGAEVIAGIGNSVLWILPPEGPRSADLVAWCRTHDLFIREIHDQDRATLRIAVKDAAVQERMLELLGRGYEATALARSSVLGPVIGPAESER